MTETGEIPVPPQTIYDQVRLDRRRLFDPNLKYDDQKVTEATESIKHTIGMLQRSKGLSYDNVKTEFTGYIRDVLKNKSVNINSRAAEIEVASGLVGANENARKTLINKIVSTTTVDSQANLHASEEGIDENQKRQRETQLPLATREILDTGLVGIVELLKDPDYRSWYEASKRIHNGGTDGADVDLIKKLFAEGKTTKYRRYGVVFDSLKVNPIDIIDEVLDEKKGAYTGGTVSGSAFQQAIPSQGSPSQAQNLQYHTQPSIQTSNRSELVDILSTENENKSKVWDLLVNIESLDIPMVTRTQDEDRAQRDRMSKYLEEVENRLRGINDTEFVKRASARMRLHDASKLFAMAPSSRNQKDGMPGEIFRNPYVTEPQKRYKCRPDDITTVYNDPDLKVVDAFSLLYMAYKDGIFINENNNSVKIKLSVADISPDLPKIQMHKNGGRPPGYEQKISEISHSIDLLARETEAKNAKVYRAIVDLLGGDQNAKTSLELAKRILTVTGKKDDVDKHNTKGVLFRLKNLDTYRRINDSHPGLNIPWVKSLGIRDFGEVSLVDTGSGSRYVLTSLRNTYPDAFVDYMKQLGHGYRVVELFTKSDYDIQNELFSKTWLGGVEESFSMVTGGYEDPLHLRAAWAAPLYGEVPNSQYQETRYSLPIATQFGTLDRLLSEERPFQSRPILTKKELEWAKTGQVPFARYSWPPPNR